MSILISLLPNIFDSIFPIFTYGVANNYTQMRKKKYNCLYSLYNLSHGYTQTIVLKRNVPYGLVQLKLHNPTTVWATNQHSFIPFFIDWLNDLC